MTWHFAPGRTIVLGTVLILALVALQPLALGLFPVGAPDSDPGIGTGTGDLTAGALSALVRDLNADGAVPSHARSVSPVVLLPLDAADDHTPRRMHARAADRPHPASTLAGTSARGYQLLL